MENDPLIGPDSKVDLRDTNVVESWLRAAIKAIEVETPKMSAVAIATLDGKSFAEALDRCIERSKGPVLLNGRVEPLPAEDLKGPMPRYRNNYRRF